MRNTYPKWSRDWIISDKTGVEGGYVNNPNDKGGETNHGITKAVADSHKPYLTNKYGWNGNMRNLTVPMAYDIYVKDYWNRVSLDLIHSRCPFIADKLFDIAINMGSKQAATWFQTILNALNKNGSRYPSIEVDGQIGAKTIETFDALSKQLGNKAARYTIIKSLIVLQGARYLNLAESREQNKVFLLGWLNRLDHNLTDYFTALN